MTTTTPKRMVWKAPDKPQRIYSLKAVTEGDYIAQVKIDGHAAVIMKNGDLTVTSRHGKPLKISDELMRQLGTIGLSDGDAVVGEWTGLRKSNRTESMQIFSQVYKDYKWLGRIGEEERANLVTSFRQTELIQILESVTTGYADLYKSTINDWVAEGIVLKHRQAKLIGDREESKKNKLFLKLKWRDGASGEEMCIVPDEDLVCKSA